MDRTALYRTIWRWHFYAGLFVIPLILILAGTGAFYLFKPQVERWEERAWLGFPAAGSVAPDAQRDAALRAFPGARFQSYRLPREEGDAAMIHLILADGHAARDVFVSPQGKVVGSLDSETRLMAVDQKIHGQLLLGKKGSWIVELAASWAIVMLITGLYLWWPDGRGLAGVVWPRTRSGGRVFLRDLHAVTGFWAAGLAMVLLLSGLPWADVWGKGFKAVRQEMGWVKGEQDWTIGGRAPDAGGEHAEHDHAAKMAGGGAAPGTSHIMPDGTVMTMEMAPVSLSQIVAEAKSEHLAFPVIVTPPGASQRSGGKANPSWTVRSDAQNRPLRVTIKYDAMTGKVLSREDFADKHIIDRVVGYGVAWHEGALFGWVNQLIGLLTALMLITLAVSGFLMWRKRKPADKLGALPPPRERRIAKLVPVILLLTALLPLLAASLIAMLIFDRLILPRLPRLSDWLGMPAEVAA